jgi:hypothetical protein
MADTTTPTVEIQPILCEYTGTFCGALTVEQLVAAGRARLCCRSYIDDVGEDE